MYISSQPPPVLTLGVPGEITIRSGTESQPLKLQPYQIVRAVVAEGGLERVVLNVEHQKLAAKTKVPLKSGQQLNLQVLATTPRIHLRIMEETELKHLFRMLHSLDESIRLLPVLAKMHNIPWNPPSQLPGQPPGQPPVDVNNFLARLMGFLRQSPTGLSGRDLAGLHELLGLNLEALLAQGETERARNTLKAVLFMFTGGLGKETACPVRERAGTVLERLRLFGLCRYRLGHENVHFLPLPLPFLEIGYLLAEREGGTEETPDAEKDKGAWKVTLHLKLSVLGCLEVRLLYEEGGVLRLRFLCENDQVAETVSAALPMLADRLTSVTLAGFSVGTGAGDPVASLLKRLAPHGDHFLAIEV